MESKLFFDVNDFRASTQEAFFSANPIDGNLFLSLISPDSPFPPPDLMLCVQTSGAEAKVVAVALVSPSHNLLLALDKSFLQEEAEAQENDGLKLDKVLDCIGRTLKEAMTSSSSSSVIVSHVAQLSASSTLSSKFISRMSALNFLSSSSLAMSQTLYLFNTSSFASSPSTTETEEEMELRFAVLREEEEVKEVAPHYRDFLFEAWHQQRLVSLEEAHHRVSRPAKSGLLVALTAVSSASSSSSLNGKEKKRKEEIACFCTMARCTDSLYRVTCLYCLPEYRKRGLGTRLMRETLDYMFGRKENSFKPLSSSSSSCSSSSSSSSSSSCSSSSSSSASALQEEEMVRGRQLILYADKESAAANAVYLKAGFTAYCAFEVHDLQWNVPSS
ncbi:hypothetical protein QOT17_000046 [Balamuthia mandrillaris]